MTDRQAPQTQSETRSLKAADLNHMLLDARGAAEFLLCSEATVWRRVAEGQLPVVKFGGRTLYLREDLEAFVRSHRQVRDPAHPAKPGRPKKAPAA